VAGCAEALGGEPTETRAKAEVGRRKGIQFPVLLFHSAFVLPTSAFPSNLFMLTDFRYRVGIDHPFGFCRSQHDTLARALGFGAYLSLGLGR
jgi:hypothetical protein